MSRLITVTILFFGISCILLCGCCKEKCTDPTNPACSNYDPCYKALKASFKFGEVAGGLHFTSDTVSPEYLAFFAATCDADSFIWYLGGEVIREKSFVRKYFPPSSTIPVKLVVKKNKLIDGCTKDKLVDTLSKSLFVTPDYGNKSFSSDTAQSKEVEYRPIEGKYYGHYKSAPT
jgi:hypothetical protein